VKELKAKVFKTGRAQAVRIPKDFRFSVEEVYIRKDEQTGDIILSQKPLTIDGFLAKLDAIPDEEKKQFQIDTTQRDMARRNLF
jgi:antitoxin VapB